MKRELKAPAIIVAGCQEWELAAGALVIGRDPSVDVSLMDPLVSRRHARLTTRLDGSIVIEDLQSANGVFLNGDKLIRPMVTLHEGDRLLLGTTEISVFSLRGSAKVSSGQDRPPKATDAGPERLESDGVIQSARRRRPVTTGRGAPIDMIGQFAEQLMGSGHPEDAIRALSEPLQNLLKGISAGLNVDASVLDSAAHYALKLHDWTKRIRWVEYVIELHLACRRVPSDGVLTALEDACHSAGSIDPTLLQFLVVCVKARPDPMTPEEASRVARIERLLPPG